MATNANPLIKTTKADTIDEICIFIDYMRERDSHDEDAHPGRRIELQLLEDAVRSLTDGQ